MSINIIFGDKKQKILLKNIFEFLNLNDILISSGLNKHIFEYIKKSKQTESLKEVKHLLKIGTKDNFKSLTNILNKTDEMNCKCDVILEYITLYFLKSLKKSFFIEYIDLNSPEIILFEEILKNLYFNKISKIVFEQCTFNTNLLKCIQMNLNSYHFLENFKFKNSRLTDNLFQSFDIFLSKYQRIFKLKFLDCSLTNENVVSLLCSLANSNSLKNIISLNLSKNLLNDSILKDLGYLINIDAVNMKSLNLSDNKIGDSEASLEFLASLKSNKNLKKIVLNGCLFNESSFQFIKELYYSDNQIKDFSFLNNIYKLRNTRDLFDEINIYQKKKFSFSDCGNQKILYCINNTKKILKVFEFKDEYFPLIEGLKFNTVNIKSSHNVRSTTLLDKNMFIIENLAFKWDSVNDSTINSIIRFINSTMKLHTLKIKDVNKHKILNLLPYITDGQSNFKVLKMKNMTSDDTTWLKYICNLLLDNQIEKLVIKKFQKFKNKEIMYLSKILHLNNSLRILKIKDCSFNQNGIEYLKNCIEKNPNKNRLKLYV